MLTRNQDDNLGLEELDTLQGDLERLLASVGRRLKLLESEIQVLVNWQDKKDKKPLTVGKVVCNDMKLDFFLPDLMIVYLEGFFFFGFVFCF